MRSIQAGIFIFLMTSFLVAASGLFAVGASDLEVWIHDKVSVSGDTVHLGDIASFDPETDRRVGRLRKIPVAAAPPPGETRVLSGRFLVYKMGSSLEGMQGLRLKVPESLRVRRTAQVIGVAELEKRFKGYVLQHSPWPAERVYFETIRIAGPVRLPEGKVRWEVKDRGNPDYVGEVSVLFIFWANGRLVKKIPVTGRVSVEMEVVKAAREIRRGEIISRDDLVSASERTLYVREARSVEIEELIGKRALRPLKAGQVITEAMVEAPPLVRRGERVMIRAESPQILVTARGKALEDGRAGQQIRVVNVASGREVFATVYGPGLVKVDF